MREADTQGPSPAGPEASTRERLRERLALLRAAGPGARDPSALARKLADRAKQLRNRLTAPEGEGEPFGFLAFRRGRDKYGVPLEYVLEVQALEQLSPVPGVPAFIRGVVPWRGVVLALLDLTRLFEVAEVGLADVHGFIVVEAAGKRLALAASAVEDLVVVPRARLRPVPELSGRSADWVLGVEGEDRLILAPGEIVGWLEQAAAR